MDSIIERNLKWVAARPISRTIWVCIWFAVVLQIPGLLFFHWLDWQKGLPPDAFPILLAFVTGTMAGALSVIIGLASQPLTKFSHWQIILIGISLGGTSICVGILLNVPTG